MKKFFNFPKKFVSLLLVVVMAVTVMPSQSWLLIASAEESDLEAQTLTDTELNKTDIATAPEEVQADNSDGSNLLPTDGKPVDAVTNENTETLPEAASVFTITINYVYGESAGILSGSIANEAYIATMAEGSAYSVASPAVAAYEPDQAKVEGNLTTDNTVINVVYNTVAVNYEINHIFEGLLSDGSDKTIETETLSGTAGALTNAQAKNKPGFTAGVITQAPIVSDGKTVIDINYTRNADVGLFAATAANMKVNTITYNGGTIDGSAGTLPGSTQTSFVNERYENVDGKVADNMFVNDGYRFNGWVDVQSSPVNVDTIVSAGSDLTLTATWVINKSQWVTVTFDANGGVNVPAPKSYKRSEVKAVLEGKGSMSHGTNIFGGWSATPINLISTKDEYDSSLSNRVTEIDLTDVQYSKHTVYAVWLADANGPTGQPDGTPDALQFKITYNINGGSGAVPTDSNIYSENYSAPVKFDVKPTKDGSEFLGWAKTSTAKVPDFTEAGAKALTMHKENVTLFAVYGVKSVKYEVRYISALNGVETVLEVANESGTYGQDLVLSAKAFTGYSLTVADKQNVTLGKTEDNNFVFKYAPIAVDVITKYLNAKDNTEVAPTQANGSNFYYGEVYSFSAVTVEGFTVKEATKQLQVLTTGKQEVVFLYDINNYTITYEPNNAAEGNVKQTQNVDHGANTSAKGADTFKAEYGKKFLGWSENPSASEPTYKAGNSIVNVKAPKTLYAVWANMNVNTITYNGGTIDGGAGTLPGSTQTSFVNERYENVDGKVADNMFVNDGYRFNGWVDVQSSPVNVGTIVSAGSDLTLTATWAKDNTQWGKLIYNANGGSTPPAASEYKLNAGTINLIFGKGSTTNPATPNVIFGGWTSTQHGFVYTKAEYDTAMAAVVTSVKLKTGDNNVYAVWLVDENGPDGLPDGTPDALQFKITYLKGAAGAKGTTEDTNLYSLNYSATLLANKFSYNNYIFTSWSVGGTAVAPDSEIIIKGNTEVTALWKLDENGPDGKPDQIPDDAEYSVLYFANGGSGAVPKDSNIYPENYSASVKFDVKPTMEGYAFLGWDTDSKAITPEFTQGGTTKVSVAKNGVKLYAIYGASNVTYNVSYVSRRLNSSGNTVEKTLEKEENLPGNFDQNLTLLAKDIVGYSLTSAKEQNVTLGKTENNSFVFYYAPNPSTVVSLYLEEGTNTKLLEDKNWGENYQYGVSYTIEAPQIAGFTAKVNKIDFTIDSELQQVVFYYTRNKYAYEIRYETADGTPLVVPTTGSADFKANITTDFVKVDGYTPRAETLTMEIGTDETKNVITFVYDANAPVVTPPVTPETPGEPPVGPAGPITPVTPPQVIETQPEEIEIPDEETALVPGTDITGPVEIIDDEETALAAASSAWALINLILTIFTGLIMVLLFVWYFIGKKKNNDKEEKDSLKRKGGIRLLSVVPTIAAIVFFILTENMLSPMVWVDKWTIWMAVIAVVQIVVALFCRKNREDNDKENSDKNKPSANLSKQNA